MVAPLMACGDLPPATTRRPPPQAVASPAPTWSAPIVTVDDAAVLVAQALGDRPPYRHWTFAGVAKHAQTFVVTWNSEVIDNTSLGPYPPERACPEPDSPAWSALPDGFTLSVQLATPHLEPISRACETPRHVEPLHAPPILDQLKADVKQYYRDHPPRGLTPVSIGPIWRTQSYVHVDVAAALPNIQRYSQNVISWVDPDPWWCESTDRRQRIIIHVTDSSGEGIAWRHLCSLNAQPLAGSGPL